MPSFEDTVGQYNNEVLKALDNTLALLHKSNIKAIISPHDANQLTNTDGRCDSYCQKYEKTAATFYSSSDAKADYDARISAILNFKSPNFGNKAWKDLSKVIYAFDLQNEPMISNPENLSANDPDDWVCGRAGEMRKVLGASEVLVATGGIGGSHYCCDHEFNLIEKALQCDTIDILSVHSYMSKAGDWAYYITGDKSVLRLANEHNKLVMVEEWGVAADSQDNFAKQVKVFNDAGVPWVSKVPGNALDLFVLMVLQLYWQFVPGKDGTQPGVPTNCEGGYDGFEIGLDSPKGDIKAAVQEVNKAAANQTWPNV